MQRVYEYFLFLLYDKSNLKVYICAVMSEPPYHIHSFFLYQISRTINYYQIFPTADNNKFLISSNQESIFYELTLHKMPLIKIWYSKSFSFDFDLYISAKNIFFSKELKLSKNWSHDFNSFHSIFKNIFIFICSYWIIWVLIACIATLFIFHLLIKKLLFIKFLNSKRDYPENFNSSN